MKNNIFSLFYFVFDAPEFYVFAALSLSGSLFLFLASAIEPRPDLFYPKIITTAVGFIFLILGIRKHIREGL